MIFSDDPSAKSQSVQVVSILYTVIPCLLFAIVFSSVVIFVCWRYHKQIIYQASQSAATPLVPVVGKPTYPKVRQLSRKWGSGGWGMVVLRSFCLQCWYFQRSHWSLQAFLYQWNIKSHIICKLKGAQSRNFELFWRHAKLPLNWREPENSGLLR